MIRRLMLTPLFAALVIAGQSVSAAAYHDEVRYERSTLEEIRSALQGRTEPTWGPLPRSGLGDRRPFRARFTDVLLSRYDEPRLTAIVGDAASLPPDSLVEIQGRMDGEPFQVTIRSDRDGRKAARLEGLVFRDRYEALDLMDGLVHRGVQHARLDGRIGDQHVVGRIENGMTRFEG